MIRQIAIRLPGDFVEFLDELVEKGDTASRTAAVARALERERRRRTAERDAAIMARSGADVDLDDLASYSAAIPMGDLD